MNICVKTSTGTFFSKFKLITILVRSPTCRSLLPALAVLFSENILASELHFLLLLYINLGSQKVGRCNAFTFVLINAVNTCDLSLEIPWLSPYVNGLHSLRKRFAVWVPGRLFRGWRSAVLNLKVNTEARSPRGLILTPSNEFLRFVTGVRPSTVQTSVIDPVDWQTFNKRRS